MSGMNEVVEFLETPHTLKNTSHSIEECLSIITFNAYDWADTHSDGDIHM